MTPHPNLHPDYVQGRQRQHDTTDDPYLNLLIAIVRQAQLDTSSAREDMRHDAHIFLDWCIDTMDANKMLLLFGKKYDDLFSEKEEHEHYH